MSKKKQKLLVVMYKCPCCEYESRNNHHYKRHMKRWNHFPKDRSETKIVEESKNDFINEEVKVEIKSENKVEKN